MVAFAMFGVLQGLKTGVDEAIARSRGDILWVGPSAYGGAPLPAAYLERLKQIPGVKTVSFSDVLLGTYQKPTQVVYVLALAPGDVWLTLMPEIFNVLPKDLQALQSTRSGALISADIAKTYGWHVADRIPLTSTTLQANGSGNWVFESVGTFKAHEVGAGGYIVANYTYLDETRVLNKGTVRNFYVVVSDAQHASAVADLIDGTFANSSNETTTVSLRENAQQQMQSIGDLSFAIRSIVGAVVVALLFSLATMKMQAIEERTPELAILKTLGFTGTVLFFLLIGEALAVCITASIFGLALAAMLFPYAAKFVPGLSMPMIVIEAGVIGAAIVALISVALPAVRVARLRVTDAFAVR